MSCARREFIVIEDTSYYHCISCCVRRAYLCGEDFQSGQNFDHRKVWLVERINFLASVFAIDEESWIESVARFHHYFYDAGGSVTSLDQYQKAQKQRREKQKGR